MEPTVITVFEPCTVPYFVGRSKITQVDDGMAIHLVGFALKCGWPTLQDSVCCLLSQKNRCKRRSPKVPKRKQLVR
jgi:hypothetical protein